mmetsp:Transcript_40432/g.94980  ORF Transcript_40432/g.94980 Transcript_40432/m.94980 type:complete len:209 (-) Transcript_40432:6384-7010(-)
MTGCRIDLGTRAPARTRSVTRSSLDKSSMSATSKMSLGVLRLSSAALALRFSLKLPSRWKVWTSPGSIPGLVSGGGSYFEVVMKPDTTASGTASAPSSGLSSLMSNLIMFVWFARSFRSCSSLREYSTSSCGRRGGALGSRLPDNASFSSFAFSTASAPTSSTVGIGSFKTVSSTISSPFFICFRFNMANIHIPMQQQQHTAIIGTPI